MSQKENFPEPLASIDVNSVVFTFQDIQNTIGSFYGKVEVDPLLKVPFQTVEDWGHHVERLTHFWWIRFGGRPYLQVSYNPVEKHFHAGFNQEFLSRWLGLFQETLEEHLSPEQAQLWGMIAGRMGQSLSFRNEEMKKYFQELKEEKK